MPIAVLVFLGAFVPIVGALVTGVVAVLVALVSKGFITAVIMLGVVIAVQQLEAHVLQPFLLGRAVEVHPLAVILGSAPACSSPASSARCSRSRSSPSATSSRSTCASSRPNRRRAPPPHDPTTQTPAEDADAAKDEAGPLADAPVPDHTG